MLIVRLKVRVRGSLFVPRQRSRLAEALQGVPQVACAPHLIHFPFVAAHLTVKALKLPSRDKQHGAAKNLEAACELESKLGGPHVAFHVNTVTPRQLIYSMQAVTTGCPTRETQAHYAATIMDQASSGRTMLHVLRDDHDAAVLGLRDTTPAH